MPMTSITPLSDFGCCEGNGFVSQIQGLMEQVGGNMNLEQVALSQDQSPMLREVRHKRYIYTVKGEADIIAIASQAGSYRGRRMCKWARVLGGNNYFPDVDSEMT